MKKVKGGLIGVLVLIALLTVINSAGAQPAEVWVDDDGPDNGSDHFDTIQEGINAVADGGTVHVAAGTYSPFTNGESFPITIGKSLSLIGDGKAVTTISAAGGNRVFLVAGGITAAISGVTITSGGNIFYNGGSGIWNSGTLTMTDCTVSGNAVLIGFPGGDAYGGGISNDGTLTMINCTVRSNIVLDSVGTSEGGGIWNNGTLTMTNCTVSGNTASSTSGAFGGGIYNIGTLTMTNCTVSGNTITNSPTSYGGGIYNIGALTIDASSITGNHDGGAGGGIYNYSSGTVTITDSTISGNYNVLYGGGVFNNGIITITNSTISGNIATRDGGGINHWSGTLTIDHSTITDNAAGLTWSGGGIWNNNTLNAKNTIVAYNFGQVGSLDISGPLNSYGYNYIEDTTGCTITELASPGTTISDLDYFTLGTLQNNGGPTMTHALLPGSPEIDGGSCTDVGGNPVPADQRGVKRPQGSGCDIGAYEYPQISVNPVAAFMPVKNYYLSQVNAYLECIEENLPDDVPDDIQELLDAIQRHIDNANTTNNTIYASNELLKALEICEETQEKLGITCS